MTDARADAVTDADLLRSVADRIEQLAARTTAGDWRPAGLLKIHFRT